LLQLLRTNRSHGEVSLCVLALLKERFVERGEALSIANARIRVRGEQDFHKVRWIKNDAAFEDAMERCVTVRLNALAERFQNRPLQFISITDVEKAIVRWSISTINKASNTTHL
jgi:hypothetical protein